MKKFIKYMIIMVCSFSTLIFTSYVNNTDNSLKTSLENRLEFKKNIILDLNYGKVKFNNEIKNDGGVKINVEINIGELVIK